MSEASIAAAHCIVFDLESDEHDQWDWKAAGTGDWADMHVFHEDAQVPNYRMVGWIRSDNSVVLNVDITSTSEWSYVTDDFGQLTTMDGTAAVGLMFTSPEKARKIGAVVLKAIQDLKDRVVTAPPPPPFTKSSRPPQPMDASAQQPKQTVSNSYVPPNAPGVPGGKTNKRISLSSFAGVTRAVETAISGDSTMATAVSAEQERLQEGGGEMEGAYEPRGASASPVRNSKARTASTHDVPKRPPMQEGDPGFASPSSLLHNMHVTFNHARARYEGLPREWSSMNQQFGIPLLTVPKVEVEGYGARVPAVLVMMNQYLKDHDARQTVGIFRLAPDKDECALVKKQINSGEFETCEDINVIANLIKVFFRELPEALFDVISEKEIYRVCESDISEVPAFMETVPEPHRSIIDWLMDAMANIVTNEKVNMMSAKNIAIVLSPNLFSVATENPMVALTLSQKIAEFTTVLLVSRLRTHHNYVLDK